jgi:5-methylcytosine-specific restriction enzyme A
MAPLRPARLCAEPSCHELVYNGSRCPQHQLPVRPRGPKPVYGPDWPRIRREYLAAFPYCVECGADAVDVDHITSLARGGDSSWTNLQSMCKSCHSRKTAARDTGYGNPRR